MVTHLSFGLLLTLGWFSIFNPGIPAGELNLYLAIAAVAALLPDIDHPKSFISNKHWMLKGTSRAVDLVSHHRGITHSLLALIGLMLLFTLALGYMGLDTYLIVPFTLGYVSHLLSDSLNPSGVKWLQPLWNKTFKIPTGIKIKTGTLLETLLGSTMALIFLLIYTQFLF